MLLRFVVVAVLVHVGQQHDHRVVFHGPECVPSEHEGGLDRHRQHAALDWRPKVGSEVGGGCCNGVFEGGARQVSE